MTRINIKNENLETVAWLDVEDAQAQIQSWSDNGQWIGYTFELQDVSYEHDLEKCIKNRIAEYPSFGDFLNAYFDGGQTALDALQQQRLAVKAKYPKPTGV